MISAERKSIYEQGKAIKDSSDAYTGEAARKAYRIALVYNAFVKPKDQIRTHTGVFKKRVCLTGEQIIQENKNADEIIQGIRAIEKLNEEKERTAEIPLSLDDKLNYTGIAEKIAKKFNIVVHNDIARIYQDGVYIDGRVIINHEIKVILDGLGYQNEKIIDDTKNIWYHLLNREYNLEYPFDSWPNAIPVLNGVVVINYETGTWQLEPHDPKYLFTFKLPIKFNKDASPAKLEEVFKGWVSEEDVPLLYQLPAQALLQVQGSEFKKAYLLRGKKNTGKTTYAVHFLNRIFGEEFICRIPLQELTADRFALADLEGKILNAYDDLETMRLDEVGRFKAITGSQYHDILKKRQHRYRGRIYALMLFTSNDIPILKDTLEADSAFFERWEILTFITEYPPNDNFREEFLSEENISAALNKILEEMVRIKKDNLFRKSSADDIKEIWLKDSDTFGIIEFIGANFDPDVNEKGEPIYQAELSKDEVTAAFRKFADERKKQSLDKVHLCPKLYNRGFVGRHARNGDKRQHVLTGFKWKEKAPHRVMEQLQTDAPQQALKTT